MLYSEICLVPLTTVSQDSYKIGYTATEMLINKIKGTNNFDSKLIMFSPKIVERVSV